MSTTTGTHAAGGRRRGAWLLRALLVLLAVELASALALSVLERRPFGPGLVARLAAERRRLAASGGDEASAGGGAPGEAEAPDEALLLRLRDQVLHPYVGYVFDPAFNTPGALAELGGRRVTEYGFIGDEGFFHAPAPDRVVVGIAGGSVAVFFLIHGADVLVERLREAPELAGKELVFVPTALLGYKQPQQLLALAYCLGLGARFDWVINLDGFNEVTLPVIENLPKGVAAAFPRSWYWRVQDVPDPALRRWVGQAAWLEEQRARLARSSSVPALGWSPTWNLAWRLRDRGLARELAGVETRLLSHAPEETGFAARGPWREYASDAELYDHLAELWAASSLQMHRLCAANGARYFHFLQPNQYVPGSKPMGEAERRLAVSAGSPFRVPAEEGYPRLAREGEGLRAAGVAFHDLTGVFAEVEQPVYSDNCCHLNAAGNRLLAERIAAAILADLRNAGEAGGD